MWRLALVLAVVAGSCDACPESCECHHLPDPEDRATLIEAVCLGKAPRPADLPSTTRRLRILNVEESEVLDFLEDLVNGTSSLPYLDDFAFTNCSLSGLNASVWSVGIEKMRILNISRNQLSDLDDVRWTVQNQVNISGLTTLDVSDNLVHDLSADTFRTLPVLGRLSLKGNGISTVHARAFTGLGNLEDLNLADNELLSLPNDALTPLESLQKLDLSGNQLQVLGARWFESLGRLRELDVSRNGLARAASGALQPLPGLSVLRLAGNPLRERDVSLLLGTGRKLETVDASRTGLIRVPAALTRSVRALRLAGNKLTSIRGGDLDSYPLLRLLDMSQNRLTDVEDDALGRLEALEDLDLCGNSLTQVPRSLPGSLATLNLERNAVKMLRLNDLQGLYNLRRLFLRGNEIAVIQEAALGQLVALEVLDISDNPIKELPANTLNGPTRLNTLRMSGLIELQWSRREQGDMTFPVPAPERLVDLDVSKSPVLAAQLLADTAALSACKSLVRLDLEETNTTTLRPDLVYFVAQLRVLGLGGNPWNCTEDIYWLGEWSREHEELEPFARCAENGSDPIYAGTYLTELPSPPTPPDTTPKLDNSERTTSETGQPRVPETNTTTSYDSNDVVGTDLTTENSTLQEQDDPGTEAYSMDTSRRETERTVEYSESTEAVNAPQSLTRSTTTRTIEEEVVEVKIKINNTSDESANTVAEELSSKATDSGSRVSEALSAGAHPGMLILVGAALGAVAALSVVLSRRATARRRDCCYQRQENIEVHTLTPVTAELW